MRRRGLRSGKLQITNHKSQIPQRGYMLITLMLVIALAAMAALAILPEIGQQIRRDREEELIHRGVQYSRAIKHYVKKFGRYPTRIEDLEKTNEVRFLRKRYKDPITGKDFKILTMTDVQLAYAGEIGGAPGAPPGNPLTAGGLQGPGGPGAQANAGAGGLNGAALTGGFAGGGFAGGGTGPGLGGLNPNPGGVGTPGTTAGSNGGQDSEETAGEDTNPAGSNASPGQNQAGQPTSGPLGQSPGAGNNQVFGGGPMVGVASTSKDKTIRVFNKKDHYNQWQFIYDPSTDRGGLLTTPSVGSQSLTSATPTTQPGAPATPGTGAGASGQQSPTGTQSGPPGMQPPPSPPDQEEP